MIYWVARSSQAALHDWLPDALLPAAGDTWVLSSGKDLKLTGEKGLPETKVCGGGVIERDQTVMCQECGS